MNPSGKSPTYRRHLLLMPADSSAWRFLPIHQAYGVDPASISITQSDGVVRYVMVATSASGARNVMYEGIRCSTGEFKTYARYSADGKWNLVSDPQWRSMFGNMPSKHSLRLAKAGACDNAAPATSVKEIVSRLKNPNYRVTP